MRTSYALAAAMVAMASNASASSFDGFYAGGNLGYNSTDLKITETITPSSSEWDGNGADFGLHAGYGKVVGSNFYVGGEIEANLSNADITESGNGITLKGEKEHSYGAAVRAGLVFDNIMPYARLGYTKSKFKATSSGSLVGSSSESKSGVSYGAGLQAKVTDAVSVRGELVRTNYRKFSATNGVDTITLKPKDTVARIGVSVHF